MESPTEIELLKKRFELERERWRTDFEKILASEKALSASYVRIRTLVSALSLPHAVTPEEIHEITERKVEDIVGKIRRMELRKTDKGCDTGKVMEALTAFLGERDMYPSDEAFASALYDRFLKDRFLGNKRRGELK